MVQFRELTDHYRLEKILSSSRSATVLKGTELLTDRSVAIKMINVADPAGLTAGAVRFARLAEVIKGLGHRNLPQLLDSGFTTEGSAFLVTELLSGARFEALAGAPPDRTLPLLIGAVEGIAALAEAGVAHLNIAPQNLFVTAADGLEAARLLGLGTPIFRPAGAALDAKDETARFRAPEVAAGGPGDAKADVYSLAMTVCHALGATVAAGGASIQLPLSLSFDLANAEVLRRILERSLDPSPAARPTPRELRSALRLALGFTEPAAFAEPASSPAAAPEPAAPSPAAAPLPAVAPTLSPAARAEPVLPGLADLDLTSLDLSLPVVPPKPASTPPPAPIASAPFPAPMPAAAPARAAAPPSPPPLIFHDDGIPPSAYPPEEPPPSFPAPGALPFDDFDEPMPPLSPMSPPDAGDPGFPALPPLAAEPPAFSPPLPPPPAAAPALFEPPAPPPPKVTPPAVPPPRPAAVAPAAPVAASPLAAAAPRPPLTAPSPPAPAASPTPPMAEGDVLGSIDDDLLQPLPPPAATPPPAARGKAKPAPRPAAPAAPSVAGAAAPGRLFGLPRMLVLGAAAGLVLLVFAAVAWWFLGRSEAPGTTTAGEPASQAALPPPPKVPPKAKLQLALELAGQGQDYKAWQALQAISFGEQGALAPEQCRAVAALETSLAQSTLEHLPADLVRGVANGDLDELRGMEVAASRLTPSLGALPPEAQEGLSKVKSVLALYAAAQKAAAARKPEEVLDRLAAAKAAVPNLTDPDDLRNKAAEAILAEAAGQARAGQYDAAIARLAPVRRTWPDRPGLSELATAYETAKKQGQEQEALLATLPNFERRRKPAEGLAAIRTVQPVPHLEAKFAEARRRLEAQLFQLDGRPPQVVLRDGYSLIYSRGTVANLSFRVTDDYEVVSVRMMAGPVGGKMRNFPLDRARNGAWYTAEIRPEFHHNATVRFYVLATDVSGHVGELGSESQPLELKRSGDLGLR